MRTVALIALVVLIGVAQCGLIRRSKVEKSNFFDDIANVIGGLFSKPAHSWNSQGTHFNVSNSTNSSNSTNNTWNSKGWRFAEVAEVPATVAPATEAPAPVAETPAPVAAEKPKKKTGGHKHKGKKHAGGAKPWKKHSKKTEKTAENTEQSNFFDDIANVIGGLFSKPAHSWNSQGTHFNVSNSSNSTNTTWNSKGWRFEETAEKSNFFDDIANVIGGLFSKPAHSWNSQGTHFNVSNSSNSTNNTWNSKGWRFEETADAAPAAETPAPAAEAPAPVAAKKPKKKRGFFGKVGGFFKGIWAKRPWAKKKQTETTTEESDFVANNWNSQGYTFPQPQYVPYQQPQPQRPWNSQGYTFPQQQQQQRPAWNSQGYRYY